jgi:hypothetical protein
MGVKIRKTYPQLISKWKKKYPNLPNLHKDVERKYYSKKESIGTFFVARLPRIVLISGVL